MIDVIVVGSGASGVNAAFPLCEAGLRVTMLDYGNVDDVYSQLVPALPFSELRRTDEQQHRYYLGDTFEGILLGSLRVGTKLTPPRLHVVADSPELMPVDSETFSANESLALGGLAASWGAGILPFRDDDFRKMPISFTDLKPHYETVAERIGVSGGQDDLLTLFGDNGFLMPAAEIDSSAEKIMKKYIRRRHHFNKQGLHMGRARLALCTKPHRGRQAHTYRDMDYWVDTDDSVYRPRYTLAELRRFPNFSYINRRFVLSFVEKDKNVIDVNVRYADGREQEVYRSRALVLCAGTMSTARIVLRSLNRYNVRIPILTNPYTYVPCINWGMLGAEAKDQRCSLAQLSAVYFSRNPSGGTALSYFFSYRSLLTFKLLKEAPLPQHECLKIMQSMMPLLGIVTIFHGDSPSSSKYCVLHSTADGGPDRLEIQYSLSDDEERSITADEKGLLKLFRRMGCWPMKRIRRVPGGSIHYSGTVPMSDEGRELTCDRECRLVGTQNIYLADGSVISPLPSIVPTFTIMANANRVGSLLAQRLTK